MGFLGGEVVKNRLPRQETQDQSLGSENSPGEEMEIHSRILAWETPWIEEPSMGSKKSQM